ncbi:MAG: M48 family metallopeptidase [Parasphingorhabdus sp.]|uniref:M48 family metallopeptidase n=1 Tax=Parasphingorhabdus sp. TaxID=2709688 RepID=UPI003001ACD5
MTVMLRFLPLLLATLLSVLPLQVSAEEAVNSPIDSQSVLALKALQLLDQRTHAVGYRLVSANAGFCENKVPNLGLLLHDINQYGDKAAARFAHGFASAIAINAVAPESPAALEELEAGDGLIAIDGQLVEGLAIDEERLASEKPEYRRIAAIKLMLADAAADGSARLTIMRGGLQQDRVLVPVQTCPSEFQVRVSEDRDASADGKIVSISSTLAEYVLSEDELAAIAAHELAHNLLKHRERLNAENVDRGFFGQFGKSAGQIKAAEIEADRLSVWLTANAGYDPQAAIRFWTRYGKQYGKGIFSASTHYRWKKRVKLFEEEIAKMQKAQADNEKYAPPLLKEPRGK